MVFLTVNKEKKSPLRFTLPTSKVLEITRQTIKFSHALISLSIIDQYGPHESEV